MTDEQRERLIEAWRQVVELDPERPFKNMANVRMSALIKDRTSEQVAAMEQAKGLG